MAYAATMRVEVHPATTFFVPLVRESQETEFCWVTDGLRVELLGSCMYVNQEEKL